MCIETVMPLDELYPTDSAPLVAPGAAAWTRGAEPRAVSMARAFLGAGTPGYRGAARYVGVSVCDGDRITASGTAPVDIAHRIFERLGVYERPVLDAWRQLYTTGDASAFHALQAASQAPDTPT